ncbi:GNAT family N-acetyltransferase [Quatrionicoccus australiensis]|uniref:GNAT family N-acetyltransferase n=1 Tax=Quatrionicoccus australiensis TaxID=138118 RepID=UPI001CFAB395|nr:GNAT family N-acetyltransferase [Quatrionicoccus australiensis]MCB4360423.1 GNAT family N-acetyltransferase [Quatrionicoccus australiensis]
MSLTVLPLDLSDLAQAEIWLELLDHYAQDPMGGGDGLSDYAKLNLVATMREVPGFHGALAWLDGKAVGLIDCFAGFSTFAARPLLNVHDIVVHRDVRGRGVGQALLAWAEARARELGCCKLTLEVLSNNTRAMRSYEQAGFAPYVLDPAAGHALFLQKYLAD